MRQKNGLRPETMQTKKRFCFSRMNQMIRTAALAGLLAGGLVAIYPAETTAQPYPPPELPMKPKKTPIDGGLALLAAAGVGYGIRKLREKEKLMSDGCQLGVLVSCSR